MGRNTPESCRRPPWSVPQREKKKAKWGTPNIHHLVLRRSYPKNPPKRRIHTQHPKKKHHECDAMRCDAVSKNNQEGIPPHPPAAAAAAAVSPNPCKISIASSSSSSKTTTWPARAVLR
jgi:hypothetical protein